MWQFLCDSWYDLVHLETGYGQKTLESWWETRCTEWRVLHGGDLMNKYRR